MKFHLSRRQQKELANGKTMRIALPYPDDGVPGAHLHHDLSGECEEGPLAAWASRCLEIGVEADIVWAGVESIPVDPLNTGADGLTRVLGKIVHAAGQRPELTVRIVCVVVEIAVRRAPRGYYPTQWPLKLVLDGGREIPPPR